jgi:hypothetical protein
MILEGTPEFNFPFKWANLDSYRKSDAFRKEIYLKIDDDLQLI